MIQLLGVVGNLATTFLEGKVEKEKARSEIMKTAAQHDSKWELIMAESTRSSWKDEIITIKSNFLYLLNIYFIKINIMSTSGVVLV